jgi:hypothetical protein
VANDVADMSTVTRIAKADKSVIANRLLDLIVARL